MKYEFKKDQLSQDIEEIFGFFWKFVKSFGPSEKKLVDRPIGFFEASHIRFRLMLVEWGISKIIRTVIVLIVGIILYFTIFRYAGPFFKVLIAGGFIIYYTWLLAPHLAEDMKFKDGKITGKAVDGMLPGKLIYIYNHQITARGFVAEKAGEFTAEVKRVFGPKKAD